jgi:hypothetical protein
MRADVPERVKVALDVEDADRTPVELDGAALARGQLLDAADDVPAARTGYS